MSHELTEPVHWKGRQWAVTGYGIEALDGMYHVPPADIWPRSDGTLPWLDALCRRYGTDREDLTAALEVARARWPDPSTAAPQRGGRPHGRPKGVEP